MCFYCNCHFRFVEVLRVTEFSPSWKNYFQILFGDMARQDSFFQHKVGFIQKGWKLFPKELKLLRPHANMIFIELNFCLLLF